MKDVELKEADQSKQLMTRDAERNGCVKVNVPESSGGRFTGLSKEELIRVAGTAGWIRTRWALLVLLWLGWVGMLAGAVVIIVQAPRCKPIPEMNWWNEGPLYQIPNLNAFALNGLRGLEGKLDYLSQLKVKALVLSAIHDESPGLSSVKVEAGSEKDLDSLLNLAHKKGISVVLNLTPDNKNSSAWLRTPSALLENIKEACSNWLKKGFDGILLSDVGNLAKINIWSSIKDLFNRTDVPKRVALMGAVSSVSVDEVSLALNRSGVDLLLTRLPDPAESGQKQSRAIQKLYSSHQQTSLGWGLGAALASRAETHSIRLYQTLLFTLPGTPVFSAGDEIGLGAEDQLETLWGLETPVEEKNAAAKALQEEHIAVRKSFSTLSELRGKERSLLHGEYVVLSVSESTLVFLRRWDQSERFLSALNWGEQPVTVSLRETDEKLPDHARVRLCTDTAGPAVDSLVSLNEVELGRGQALLLSFPYSG